MLVIDLVGTNFTYVLCEDKGKEYSRIQRVVQEVYVRYE